MKKQKRKRRTKKRYHTGSFESKKSGKVFKYRSGWEKRYMEHLDSNNDVVYWEHEPFFLKYISNIRTRKERKYFPDFLVCLSCGRKIIVEVKPFKRLGNLIVQKKIKAAKEWCSQNNHDFQIITENELKTLV